MKIQKSLLVAKWYMRQTNQARVSPQDYTIACSSVLCNLYSGLAVSYCTYLICFCPLSWKWIWEDVCNNEKEDAWGQKGNVLIKQPCSLVPINLISVRISSRLQYKCSKVGNPVGGVMARWGETLLTSEQESIVKAGMTSHLVMTR